MPTGPSASVRVVATEPLGPPASRQELISAAGRRVRRSAGLPPDADPAAQTNHTTNTQTRTQRQSGCGPPASMVRADHRRPAGPAPAAMAPPPPPLPSVRLASAAAGHQPIRCRPCQSRRRPTIATLLATTPTRPPANVQLPALEPALLLAAAGSRTRSRFVDGLLDRPNGCGIYEDKGPIAPSHSGRLRPSSRGQTIGGGSYLPKASPKA